VLGCEGKTRDEQYALGDVHIDGELAETDLHIFSSAHGFLGCSPWATGASA
jgi:hypothetical protein